MYFIHFNETKPNELDLLFVFKLKDMRIMCCGFYKRTLVQCSVVPIGRTTLWALWWNTLMRASPAHLSVVNGLLFRWVEGLVQSGLDIRWNAQLGGKRPQWLRLNPPLLPTQLMEFKFNSFDKPNPL